MSNTEPYDQYAEECRKLASRMRNPEHKKQLEDMADAWATVASEYAKKTKSRVEFQAELAGRRIISGR